MNEELRILLAQFNTFCNRVVWSGDRSDEDTLSHLDFVIWQAQRRVLDLLACTDKNFEQKCVVLSQIVEELFDSII